MTDPKTQAEFIVLEALSTAFPITIATPEQAAEFSRKLVATIGESSEGWVFAELEGANPAIPFAKLPNTTLESKPISFPKLPEKVRKRTLEEDAKHHFPESWQAAGEDRAKQEGRAYDPGPVPPAPHQAASKVTADHDAVVDTMGRACDQAVSHYQLLLSQGKTPELARVEAVNAATNQVRFGVLMGLAQEMFKRSK